VLGTLLHTLGPMRSKYEYCQAFYWVEEATAPISQERYEICYKHRDVVLPSLKGVLPYLHTLYKGQDLCSKRFQEYIQAYNTSLAFTSALYNKD